MATYQKRGTRWRAIVRKGGTSTSKTFDSKADAKRWAAGVEAEIDTGRFTDRRALKDDRLSDAIRQYVEEVSAGGNKRGTLLRVARELEGLTLAEVTVSEVLKFARKRRAAGKGPATIEQDIIFLSTFLDYAASVWELPLPPNPVRAARGQLRREKLTATSAERDRRPTPAELDALLDYFRGHWMADAIELVVEIGLRRGELVRIRWDDIDRDKRLLRVRDRKHPRFKKGNDWLVPLLGNALEIIDRQPNGGERIFPRHPHSVSRLFKDACDRLSIPDLVFHDLRHECVSRLFERGFRIEQVALVSGHRDWRQLRRYPNLRPESLHDGP